MGKKTQVVRVWFTAVPVAVGLSNSGSVCAQDGPRVLLIYDNRLETGNLRGIPIVQVSEPCRRSRVQPSPRRCR